MSRTLLTVFALVVGFIAGLATASTSGVRFGGPSEQEVIEKAVAAERDRCVGLLAWKASYFKRDGEEKAEQSKQFRKKHNLPEPRGDYVPNQEIIQTLEALRAGIEAETKPPPILGSP